MTSFTPPLTLPGALAAVISMLCSKRLWRRGMGPEREGGREEWQREERRLIFGVVGDPGAVVREVLGWRDASS